jgi:hypothetical protein
MTAPPPHGRVSTKKSDVARLARNPFGGLIVCEDRDLLVEESAGGYKAIERVIADLVDFELARVVATFRPLVTFKTARSKERRRAREERRWRGCCSPAGVARRTAGSRSRASSAFSPARPRPLVGAQTHPGDLIGHFDNETRSVGSRYGCRAANERK